MRPTVRQLEYLVAVAETLNFRAAAERCHVSQPALSAQIQQLEELLDVTLFERDRRRVLLTAAGAEIVRRAHRVLTAVDDLVDASRAQQGVLCGSLRLGVIPTIAPYLLPRILPELRKAYPQLRLVLREEQTDRLLELIEQGRLDVLLLALPAGGPGLASVELFDDPFMAAVPTGHPLAGHDSITEKDLRGESVLLLEDGHCLRDQALTVCQLAGAQERFDLRASSMGTLLQMVRGGLGLTLLPRMANDAEASGDELAVIPFRGRAPSRTIGLVWRRTFERQRDIEALAEVLRAGPA